MEVYVGATPTSEVEHSNTLCLKSDTVDECLFGGRTQKDVRLYGTGTPGS